LWPARIAAKAFSAKLSCRVSSHERANPSISSDGRIPFTYLVFSSAKPGKGSGLAIRSRGGRAGACVLPRDTARRMEAPTPAMKSRRFILGSLLRSQVVPWCSSGGERFPFYTLTQVNTSSRKGQLSMDIRPPAASPRCGAPNRLNGWAFGEFGRKISAFSVHFLLFSLNGEYKIWESKPRGKHSSCEGT